MDNLTASNLKSRLWEVLTKMKEGKMDVGEASATAGVSREIIRCVNTQIKIAAQTGRSLPVEVIEFSEK